MTRTPIAPEDIQPGDLIEWSGYDPISEVDIQLMRYVADDCMSRVNAPGGQYWRVEQEKKMTKYTKEDFENATHARHSDLAPSVMAYRGSGVKEAPWQTHAGLWRSDAQMADNGWVPLIEKVHPDQVPGRTMTESEYSAAVDAAKLAKRVGPDRLWWEGRAILFHAGVKIVADPKPEFDNETAEALTVAVWGLPLPDEAGEAGRAIARELKKAGKMIVTAPGGDGE